MNEADESSNDVIAMECEEQTVSAEPNVQKEDKPLLQFFKRLIFNKHSQSTMLTNAQLENILNKEFNLNLKSLHVLEVDIYVAVLKKYLKEWPMWDECEKVMKNLTENNKNDDFLKIFDKKYVSLKSYLKLNLDRARKLSANLIAQVKDAEKDRKALPVAENVQSIDSSGVVLEIQSTRQQLNNLIYRQPHADFNNTIFNVEEKEAPSCIRVNTLSLEAILNWWSVKITVCLQANSFFLIRETAHELEHLLVNRKAGNESSRAVELNERLQIKEGNKITLVRKQNILACLNLLSSTHNAYIEGQKLILKHLKRDLEKICIVAAPAQYRRYQNKYPYVRYLCSDANIDNGADKEMYDIQLKETISPMHQFSFGRMDIALDKTLPPQWLKVECVTCKVSCSGENLVKELRQHFDDFHQEEPDWQCTNCQKKFSMSKLAESWWNHKCEKS